MDATSDHGWRRPSACRDRLSPLSAGISVDSVRLPGQFHPDPADRMIVATARAMDANLLTADRAILTYGEQGYVRVTDAQR